MTAVTSYMSSSLDQFPVWRRARPARALWCPRFTLQDLPLRQPGSVPQVGRAAVQCVNWSIASVLLQRDALHLPSREGPGGEAAAVPVRGPRHPLRTLHLRPGQPHEVGRLQILVQISQKLCKGNLNFSHSVRSRVK